MENKIQELTDKIYREGVEKGNEEAQRLIANAQEEAKKIIEDAHKEADSIVAASRKSAEELAENTKSELKLFSGQAVNALKSEIATMVTDKLITASVKDFAQDKDYLNAFIVALASKWSVDEPIVISTADAESLKKYFAAHAKALLDKGVTIQQVNVFISSSQSYLYNFAFPLMRCSLYASLERYVLPTFFAEYG